MKNAIFAAVALLGVCIAPIQAQSNPSTPLLGAPDRAPRVWSCSEFHLDGVPAAGNPFDPDSIAVDVTFTSPSGATISMPAFWYQPYTRRKGIVQGPIDKKTGLPTSVIGEVLTKAGDPGWRVRWTPLVTGAYQRSVSVALNDGSPVTTEQSNITVAPALSTSRGFVSVEPKSKRYFRTGDGQPLPLLGENVDWTHERGTYDYDDWFTSFQKAGMNWARIWMYETFAIDFFASDRLNYNQEHAWDLDYVMNEAADKGVYLMLCLDYHGMFQTRPRGYYWNFSGYNSANGGPCATPSDFFTGEPGKALYRKRLRYLIARYGAEPSLMSWEMFNEINQDYNEIKSSDIVAWHAEMGDYLHSHDPYNHLVTTSLGSRTEQADLWSLPELDYSMYHWYSTWPGQYVEPTQMTSDVSMRFNRDFKKPLIIAEFGTSGLTVDMAEDPYRRGLREALWGGIMGGSAGTAMPWPWPIIGIDNLYPTWGALHSFISGTGFGSSAWHPSHVDTPTDTGLLGVPDSGGPFDETITLQAKSTAQPADPLVIRHPGESGDSALVTFLNGHSKPSVYSPIKIRVRTGANAHLILHLNSVSNGAILAVSVNGTEIFRRPLPNIDGKWLIDEEYNQDIDVPLPAGALDIQAYNPGSDWLYLDSIRITGALPSKPVGPAPLDAWTMTDGKTTLLWAVDPGFDYPRGAFAAPRTLTGATATLLGLTEGRYLVTWWDTKTGEPVGTQAAWSDGDTMHLPITAFQDDIAARITPLHLAHVAVAR